MKPQTPIYLCSSSKLKISHYQYYFSQSHHKRELIPLSIELPELQWMEPAHVARDKLKVAQSLTHYRPILVDDVGLCVDEMNGFPGAFLKPILEAGKIELLGRLLYLAQKDQIVSARLICAIGFDLGTHSGVVTGSMSGSLNFNHREFLQDQDTTRIFTPENQTNTISELAAQVPTLAYQHRFDALLKLNPFLND